MNESGNAHSVSDVPVKSPNVHSPSRRGYIDTWRCVAVAVVILTHLLEVRRLGELPGYVGVYIFFFISGFVVSKTCLSELKTSGYFSRAGFYVRRAFRIIPPLLVYVVACFVLARLGAIDFDAKQALAATTYLCNVTLLDCGGWYVRHTWSLAFEEQFYLLFPLIFVWVETSRRPNILLLTGFAVLASLPLWLPIWWVGRQSVFVIYGLFTLGYLFARYEQRWHEVGHSGLLFAIGLALTLIVASQHRTVSLVSIPMMIVASGSPSFPLKKIFEITVVKYLGRISYSIYLWQQLFTGYFKDLPMALNLVLLACMVVGCAALFTYVETPLIRQGKKLSNSLRRQPGVGPSLIRTQAP